MNFKTAWRVVVASAICGYAPTGFAQCELAKLNASDAAEGDAFGTAVAIDGTTLVIGAPNHDDPIRNGGAAYVYEWRSGAWRLVQKLLSSDAVEDDRSGFAVAIDDHRIAVASNQVNDTPSTHDMGAVYVFERGTSGWSQTARLLPEPWRSGDEDQTFGRVVSLSGDTLAIRSSYRKEGGVGALYGLAYVMVPSGTDWLVEYEVDEYAHRALALDGDWLASGVTGEGETIIFPGNVSLYHRVGGAWTFDERISAYPPGEQIQDYFGRSIALDGNRVLVGAIRDTIPGDIRSGSAYVFRRDPGGWAEEARLIPSDGAHNNRFGHSVALDENLAVVGAQQHEHGAVYAYERNDGTWNELVQLLPSEAGSDLHFPTSVSLDEETLACGSMGQDLPFPDAGVTFVYELDGGPEGYCSASPNSSGVPAWIGMSGSVSVATNYFRLTAGDCPPHQLGAFLYGAEPARIPFGEGYLCVSPVPRFAFVRPWPLVSISADGRAEKPVDFPSLPTAGAITGGSTWYFQFWFRDPAAGGSGFNTTPGLQVTFCP